MNKFTGEKQIRFEQFLDKITETTEKELALLEEIFQKNDAGLSGEEMENTFYEQCSVYFEIIDELNQSTQQLITATSAEYKGVLQ